MTPAAKATRHRAARKSPSHKRRQMRRALTRMGAAAEQASQAMNELGVAVHEAAE